MSISEQRELAENNAKWCAERIFRKVKTGKYEVIEYSKRTERKVRKYIDKSKSGYESIRWERIHGKNRKKVKKAIRECKKRFRKQYALWNKYVGRDDVLYIHARLGSTSWSDPVDREAPKKQPWFLRMVDDAYDSSYCDIYARIEPMKDKENTCNG